MGVRCDESAGPEGNGKPADLSGSANGTLSGALLSAPLSAFRILLLARTVSRAILVLLLALQPLEVLAIAVDLSLVAVDLLLLLVIGIFLSLDLIADERACA